jgi:uncharacterized repeat protein (TIGR01451 family)
MGGERGAMTRVACILCLAAIGLVIPASAGAQGGNADLAVVSNTASAKNAKVGDRVTFTIVATNNGPDAVDFNVYWSSDQLSLVTMVCDRGISADTPACEYGTVQPGVTLTTTVVAEVMATGSKHALGRGCTVTEATDPSPGNDCLDATVKVIGKR